MRIVQIPTLFDNYTYLIICEETNQTAIVDSPDADATWNVIKKEKVNPVAILCTHHHSDHVGGNSDLIRKKKMKVYAGERVPGLTNTVKEGDTIKVGNLAIKVLEIPGHTSGHVAYVTNDAVFCGDTLFAGVCGKIFEGTPQQMFTSLTKLKNLPDQTKVYCGHEYTQRNLEFALTVEGKNESLKKKYAEVIEKRKRNEPTVPTTIAEEKSYNPFLRWDSLELIKNVGGNDPVSVFAATRRLKDSF